MERQILVQQGQQGFVKNNQTVATESTKLTGDIEMPEAGNCNINEGKVCDVDTTDDNASLCESIKRDNKH